MAFWGSPPRLDKTRNLVQTDVITPPPGAKLPTEAEFHKKMIDGFAKRQRQHSSTTPEAGILGGLSFMRSRWTGVEPQERKERHGVVYTAIDGNRFIVLVAQDVAPHHVEGLRLGEASLLTFSKKD